MGKGRPAYVPTDEEAEILALLRRYVDLEAEIHEKREKLIDDLIDLGVPALQVARAARLNPSTLSMRVSRRRVASEHAV